MNIKWEAKEYAENFGFVPQYGRNAFFIKCKLSM
mgnify:CR=1 FL=1